MPVEIVQFCWKYNLDRLQSLPELGGCEAKLRMAGDKPYVTDNSNYIVDLYFQTPIKDSKAAAVAISKLTGGLLPLASVLGLLVLMWTEHCPRCSHLAMHGDLSTSPSECQEPHEQGPDVPLHNGLAVMGAGVVDHGLFLDMVDVVIIAAADGVQVKEKSK